MKKRKSSIHLPCLLPRTIEDIETSGQLLRSGDRMAFLGRIEKNIVLRCFPFGIDIDFGRNVNDGELLKTERRNECGVRHALRFFFVANDDNLERSRAQRKR